MKYFTLVFTLFIFTVQMAKAQQKPSLVGDWKGTIKIPGRQLGFGTHFKITDKEYSGTIDVPKQSVSHAHLEKINVIEPDSVLWVWNTGPSGIIRFNGVIKNDSTIEGKFHQKGYTFPFQLHKEKSQNEQIKPQNLPYQIKRLIIKHDSIPIGGTLTWPKDKEADHLVIMISGSGAQDRDEATPITDFKPFATLADSLTAGGFATFRYDDRGIGESGGNFGNATLDVLASDVKVIIHYFTHESDQTFDQIVLLGHSQGGVVAGKVAAEDEQVDKLILMASSGISLKKVLHYQVKQAFLSGGVTDSTAEDEIVARENLMEAIRKNKDIEKAQEDYKTKFAAIQITAGADSTQAMNAANRQTKSLTQTYGAPQVQSLLFYDPTDDLKKLDIPVLALFGSKDTQVLVSKNKAPIKQALEAAGGAHQIKTIKDANHLFQKAKTGQVQEYGSLPSKFVDGFLPTITQWIKE